MEARDARTWMSTAEQEHVRELLRACHSLLDLAEADPGLSGRTRMAAANAAAALDKVGRDLGVLAQEWRELRCGQQRAEQQLAELELRLAELTQLVEENLPAAV